MTGFHIAMLPHPAPGRLAPPVVGLALAAPLPLLPHLVGVSQAHLVEVLLQATLGPSHSGPLPHRPLEQLPLLSRAGVRRLHRLHGLAAASLVAPRVRHLDWDPAHEFGLAAGGDVERDMVVVGGLRGSLGLLWGLEMSLVEVAEETSGVGNAIHRIIL